MAGLKEPHLANSFGAHPAGREVGHAARFELHANVGDVGFPREDRQADRAHLFHRRLCERQHDVDVVDHQVKHHVHIKRAGRKDAEPVHLKEHGLRQQGECRAHRRIKAFQVANLSDAAIALGQSDHLISFG